MTSHIEEPPLRDKLTLTVPEAGALSGIPARVVRAAVLNGDMPACYAGSTTMRIRRTDLDEWVANLPVDPPTPKRLGDRRYTKGTDPLTYGPVLYI